MEVSLLMLASLNPCPLVIELFSQPLSFPWSWENVYGSEVPRLESWLSLSGDPHPS